MNFKQRKKEIIEEIENILEAYDVEWKTPAVDDMIFSLPEALYYNAFSQSLSDYKKELVEEGKKSEKSVEDLFPGTAWSPTEENAIKAVNKDFYNRGIRDFISLLQKDKENKE